MPPAPRVALELFAKIPRIGVDVHAAAYLNIDKPQPVVLYAVVKGWFTGSAPDVGQVQRIEK